MLMRDTRYEIQGRTGWKSHPTMLIMNSSRSLKIAHVSVKLRHAVATCRASQIVLVILVILVLVVTRSGQMGETKKHK